MPGTSMMALWWVPLGTSLLRSTLWSLKDPLLVSTSTEASPSSRFLDVVMPPSPLYLLMSLSPVRGSVSWAVPSDLLLSVRRCCRAECTRSRSHWRCCMTWRFSTGDNSPSLMFCIPQVLLHHPHLSSLPYQWCSHGVRPGHARGSGVHRGWAPI